MIVNVTNEQSELTINEKQVVSLVEIVINFEGESCDEVNIYFVDTPTICDLHQQFFNDPTSTDCISIPIDEIPDNSSSHRLLGEVFICPETAIDYANKNDGDPYYETSLYLVHSLLHLMGYDDIEEEDISLMRAAETRHMNNLKHQKALLRPR